MYLGFLEGLEEGWGDFVGLVVCDGVVGRGGDDDVVSVLSRRMIESDTAVQSVVDSLRSSDCYVQDSIYYAEQESLRIQDKINEIRDDE